MDYEREISEPPHMGSFSKLPPQVAHIVSPLSKKEPDNASYARDKRVYAIHDQ